jgi:NAD(P)-dependent dehydrogenase (short-subunit alcohol dehydrogenase family)
MSHTLVPGRLWITGAGKGIGRAVALEYAARGWGVAVSARTAADLDEVARAAIDAKSPGKITPFVCDVTDHDAMKQTFKAVEHAIGPLDQVIFNAGTHIPNEARTFSVAPFRTLMEINYLGSINGLSAVIPSFMDRRTGHIAVVSSVAGYRGLPKASAYGATKAALINMCEALKPELQAAGVTMSVINPGFVRTPLTDKNDFPMPFLMEPEDAAKAVFDGMSKRKFEIAFPTPFVLILKVLQMLPYGLYFWLVRKTTGV